MSKVAIIPLAKFTSEPDTQLIADLATSIERVATVKRLRNAAAKLRGVPLHGYAMRVLNEEADAIERGEHV